MAATRARDHLAGVAGCPQDRDGVAHRETRAHDQHAGVARHVGQHLRSPRIRDTLRRSGHRFEFVRQLWSGIAGREYDGVGRKTSGVRLHDEAVRRPRDVPGVLLHMPQQDIRPIRQCPFQQLSDIIAEEPATGIDVAFVSFRWIAMAPDPACERAGVVRIDAHARRRHVCDMGRFGARIGDARAEPDPRLQYHDFQWHPGQPQEVDDEEGSGETAADHDDGTARDGVGHSAKPAAASCPAARGSAHRYRVAGWEASSRAWPNSLSRRVPSAYRRL